MIRDIVLFSGSGIIAMHSSLIRISIDTPQESLPEGVIWLVACYRLAQGGVLLSSAGGTAPGDTCTDFGAWKDGTEPSFFL